MPSTRRKNKIIRYLLAPIRCLGWARDYYVRSLNTCAGQFPCEASLSYPVFGNADHRHGMTPNWSNASRDDLAELIRAAKENKVTIKKNGSNLGISRSNSEAVGRIDEDKPCEFTDCDFKVGSSLISTSRSCGLEQSSRVGSRR